MTDHPPQFTPRFSTAWVPPVSKAQRLEDERDAARNDLAAAHRELDHLRAENGVFRRIFGEAIDHVLNLPDSSKEKR